MKKILWIALITLVQVSCSDDSDTVTTLPAQNGTVLSHYKIMINEQEYKLDSSATFKALRTENMITIDLGCRLTFDTKGHLGKLVYFQMNPSRRFYTHFDNSSQHFAFDMITLDTINRRVVGSFSGYLNHNPIDFNDEVKFISGNFDVAYVDVPAGVKGLKHSATINGNYWQMTNSYYTIGEANDNNNILIHNMMDNEYKIMLGYNSSNYAVGTYTFTPASLFNTVRLAKYDMATSSYIHYNTSGTLVITQKEALGGNGFIQILSGTYTATAVNPNNPNDIIQLTNGKFKFTTPNTTEPPY